MALTRPILDNKLKVAQLSVKDSPALLNQRVAKLVSKGHNQNAYIYYLVQRSGFVNAMNIAMAGSDPPNIGNAALEKILISIQFFRQPIQFKLKRAYPDWRSRWAGIF